MDAKKILVGILVVVVVMSVVITPVSASTLVLNNKGHVEVNMWDKVPNYYQGDYASTSYGAYGTVASHGCGPTCLAMVGSYIKNEKILPDEVAATYGGYNTTSGSSWSLMTDFADDYDISVEETRDLDEVKDALAKGDVAISIQTSAGPFTEGGHFIVLGGLTSDGKIIVNDPNKYNEVKLADGFENGFDDETIEQGSLKYWIYDAPSKVNPSDLIKKRLKQDLSPLLK